MIKLGKYQHYKGLEYQVIGMAHHTETKSPMVLYKALYDVPELNEVYGETVVFARPHELFIAPVKVNNKETARFTYIGP